MSLGVPIAHDRDFVALAEILRRAQITRHQKIEERPQIENGIFHRRTCQDQFMVRADGLDGLGVLRLAILDVLRFVQHDGVESQAAIMFGVAPQQGVTGDDQVVGGHFGEKPAPLRAMRRAHRARIASGAASPTTSYHRHSAMNQ